MAGNYDFPPGFPEHAKDVISKFLTADPEQRFGCVGGGVQDVKSHPFFQDMEWDKLVRRELAPPYTPEVEDDEDISNFEEPEEADDDIDTSEITINQDDFAKW
eukprot:COSAG01_NODE_7470_length_3197_cov_27.989025_4_plen_103_part_00